MLRVIRWALPAVAALGLTVALTASRATAEDAAASQPSAVITVVGADGTAAANVEIKIYKSGEEPKHGGKKGGGDAAAPTSQPDPVADVTTKDDGKVTVALPVGDYAILASLKGSGRGKAELTVKDGDNAVTITLKAGHKKAAAAN